MSLLSDLEPPSSKQTEEIKNHNSKIKNPISSLITNFGNLKTILVIFSDKTVRLRTSFSSIYKSNSKFIPHIAILLLLAIVLVSNLTETAMAKSLFLDFTTPNPDEEAAVVKEVDQYTSLIKDDPTLLDRYFTAQTGADGFAANIISVNTQVTSRTEPLPDNSITETIYTVKNGDTLSEIAMVFDVKTSTLKYLNNIDSANAIKPGMRLKIPQKGYEVSSTLIAKREAELQKKNKLAIASRNTVARDGSGRRATVNAKPGSSSNAYPYGWCTYYVATRRYVPGGWGNAKSWLSSARRSGYATGQTPARGAIMVSAESWLGHVAYVESVNNDGTFTISEMNARGWGVTSSRKVRSDYSKIMGFVY
jgi:surface antigen